MNNKGQSLVVFIIIIPLIIVSLGMVYDLSNIVYNQNKYDNISKEIISSTLNKEEMISLYNKNGYKENNLIIDSYDDYVIVKNYYYLNSNFGNIINIKKYKIKINYIVKDINNDIIIEENKEE